MTTRILRTAVTEVEFITSNQGHQGERIRRLAERLRERRPDVVVRVTEATPNPGVLQKYKLKYGPAIAINGRLEFVGVPRFTMLLDRLLQVHEGRPNPRTAAPPETAKPAVPTRPTGPARPPAGTAPPG